MSHENPAEARQILAAALEAEAQLQEEGHLRQLGAAYDPTWMRVLEVDSSYGAEVGFGFEFWDNWVDAANHEWRHHEPIQSEDWPRYARLVAVVISRVAAPHPRPE